MDQKNPELSSVISKVTPHFCTITITVPQFYVSELYTEASHALQHQSTVYGFSKGITPVEYIQEYYKPTLINILPNLFLNILLSIFYIK